MNGTQSNLFGPIVSQEQAKDEIMGLRGKESYLKYTPEDFHKKLQEFAFQQQQEEEKINFHKAPLIDTNRLSGGSSSQGGDFIETQIESSSQRVSCVKLSQILNELSSLYLEFESKCGQCDRNLKEEEILSGFAKSTSMYTIKCPICKDSYVPKFTVYSEYKTDYLKGRDGMTITLLSPVTLYKEYINIVEQKGEQIVLKENFLREHKFVFWNIVLYFKIMKLPLFMLDLDYSVLKVRANVT